MSLNLIKKAQDAIGNDKPTDYKIKPTQFPDDLKAKAPKLSSLLEKDIFNQIARDYERYDGIATAAQKKFKNYANQATWTIFAAALSGTLLASLSALKTTNEMINYTILFFGILSTICGGVATYLIYYIKNQKLLTEWMSKRAEAETERLSYFTSIAKYIIEKCKDDIELKLLFVCMFKRYQIEVQRLYYSERSKDHKNSSEFSTHLGAISAICLLLCSGSLGMIGAFNHELLPLAALGTIGTALSTLASRREELNQDKRNTERYERTDKILSEILKKHHDILDVVFSNKKQDILLEYVETVNEQLSLEHRQWTDDVSKMSSTLVKLEKNISDFKRERNA